MVIAVSHTAGCIHSSTCIYHDNQLQLDFTGTVALCAYENFSALSSFQNHDHLHQGFIWGGGGGGRVPPPPPPHPCLCSHVDIKFDITT